MTKKGFTLIELISVLTIIAVISVIATPLILSLINKAKESSNKRNVDAYGKALEMSVLSYLMDYGKYPSDLTALEVEYTGKDVTCNVKFLNDDGSVYLSECSVDREEVMDVSSDDGWYHYGKINNALKVLLSKSNDNAITTYNIGSKESHQMFMFSHDITAQTESYIDYRYIGAEPYNYVIFNDELWRIIGIFVVENGNETLEQKIKIIRNDLIGVQAWDSKGVSEWTTASLKEYLNEDYYNSLTKEAKIMISSTKFYLGSNSVYQDLSAQDYYVFERGEEVYNSTRSTNWTGNIGLMYPSDYVYTYANGVEDTCYTNGYNCRTSDNVNPASSWLFSKNHQWLLTPYSINSAFNVGGAGYVGHYIVEKSDLLGVRPALYLSSAVKIISGDGSENNPYQLSM